MDLSKFSPPVLLKFLLTLLMSVAIHHPRARHLLVEQWGLSSHLTAAMTVKHG